MVAKSLKDRFVEALIKTGKITEKQLQEALNIQKGKGGQLGRILLNLGYIEEKELMVYLGKQLNIPPINLSRYKIDPKVSKLITEQTAKRYQLLPLSKVGKTLTVVMADPLNILAIDHIKAMTGYKINPVLSTENNISQAIEKCYQGGDNGNNEDMKDMLEEMQSDSVEIIEDKNVLETVGVDISEDAPVVKLVNLMLHEAINRGGSDILIEPWETKLQIRYRIDGILHGVPAPPKSFHQAIVSRVKIMSELDIAERRLPQDGRFKIRLAQREVDFRVSIVPSTFGEKVCLRILDKSAIKLNISEFGFSEKVIDKIKDSAFRPHGMILMCGPTGSGKTTTLYSILKLIDDPGKNLITVEDPVEFNLAGINQVSTKPAVNLTFASALRSILRQDPDIIMIGEIRDFETVDIAIKSALTGHLVLSTLHATDAPGVIVRLLNMNVEPFLITSSLLMVGVQRLVRRLCKHCRKPYEVPKDLKEKLGLDNKEEITFYKGVGCNRCYDTGYKGRIALIEILEVTEEIKDIIMNKGSGTEIKKISRKLGAETLRENGLTKVKEGITSLEEVIKVTADDEPLE
jgi:type IV pilus assembly protein PilB